MKNQYFGDINDYRKYGLLRSIIDASGFRLLVVWMLTQDIGGGDGNFISYLNLPGKWSKYDPVLYKNIQNMLSYQQKRRVGLIENTELLPNTKFFSSIIPDSSQERNRWFLPIFDMVTDCEMVFLDPDNGIQVKSVQYGRKNSSKYLYWQEIEGLWSLGKSLLIYQHFIREDRQNFIQRMLGELKTRTPNSFVEAFQTTNVVFLMALQPNHYQYNERILNTIQKRWDGQIQVW